MESLCEKPLLAVAEDSLPASEDRIEKHTRVTVSDLHRAGRLTSYEGLCGSVRGVWFVRLDGELLGCGVVAIPIDDGEHRGSVWHIDQKGGRHD